MPQKDRLMTVDEIAAEYDLSEATVRRYLRSKRVGNVIKFSNRGGYRVHESDWKKFLLRDRSYTGEIPDDAEDENEGEDAQK
ncbi:MAG: helix-turn-helix domain-containing protein [Ktedonobacterales bacterium]